MSTSSKQTLIHRFLGFYFRLICILAVDLIVTTINGRVLGLTSMYEKPIVTLIGMAVILLLFFFLFSIIDRLTKIVLKMTVEMGNLLVFRKTAVFLILCGISFGIYMLYYHTWFGVWPKIKLGSFI
ncbi:hypothetical protein NUH30_10245 [Leptospira sp. 85282-16]|uniref:RDD family protein n=1 Tax=Leptospira montravelensis TaxID=2484961 RepID=A0ABY2LS67_9LEPT|nr:MULTISPECIES: hypothetical protein [Leptospira]MCT8334053.1 hypothetical protein [Leptospira sp. 85282-16]TGK80442.1 hypothetical protein EHQ19_12245 [Leptospira montravelensis]TGL00618.1 hypothetical protein EHQ31_17675 [Leptospira montravelensis]